MDYHDSSNFDSHLSNDVCTCNFSLWYYYAVEYFKKRRSYTDELDASPLMVKSTLITCDCYGTPDTNITDDALARW